ncbi:MAG TPA: dihydrodipicolinate synthase family protein [Ottowia sp.]|uniref:dihydrodipicolinate synthase family protein n=1 Tax=Ottowia sp. TaxID=1898956 RepID=UPI002C243538|nr:dihydrodipicolinate synthase family protein [Ottowia sp.]HMN22435.1 dihydrodipicolinate synthase family protein [Ottowia sp.]
MLSGLSAFALTPTDEHAIDEAAFVGLLRRLVAARVDSIGVLGSTGSYAYLTRAERARIAALAVEQADGIPVLVGIGALRTREVLELAEDAQRAGAAAVLLAPVSYQKLHDDEVFGLYQAVSRALSVPLCVYDNPATTQFVFSDALHARIAALPAVRAIKLPPVPADPARARERVQRLRALVPPHVSLGISGDASAATGLNAGCDAWYSVLGGLFPELALALTRHAQAGQAREATLLSQRLAPLWALYARHGGSLRVIATAAELLGLVQHPCLPLPLRSLGGADRQALAHCLAQLGLSA